MVISRKQEHLHSYNSQKCINDHQQRDDLGERDKRLTNTILSCMRLYFLWASSCLKCQPTAKVEKRIKSKLGKKNSSHSSCLTKPAVRIRVGGTKFVCSTKCSHPPFPGFQCLGKSSHFMSTVLQNRNSNKFQHEYSKKHKIFQCLRDWMNSLGGCVCLSIIGHLLTNKKWICLTVDRWLKCYAPDFKLKPYMNN